MYFSENAMTSLSFPALTSVSSTLTSGEGAAITDNSALTSISPPVRAHQVVGGEYIVYEGQDVSASAVRRSVQA